MHLDHVFGSTELSLTTSSQGKQGVQVVMHYFGVVQARRTFSNQLILQLYRVSKVCRVFCSVVRGGSLEQALCRDGKVCRVLSQEFGVVRLYRTVSNYFFTGEVMCAGCYALFRGGSSNLLEPAHCRDGQVCRVL